MAITYVLAPSQVRILIEWRKQLPIGWRDLPKQEEP